MTQNKPRRKTQLEKQNLVTYATSELRQMFLNGELKPGQRIVEFDIAHKLDISRGTVRDALKHLQEENIVRIIPNRGTFVIDLSIQDLYNFNKLRGVLEGLGASIIAEKKDPEAITRLRICVEKLEQTQQDLSEFAKYDLEFHELLCALSENDFLYNHWLSMKTHIWFFICATQLFDYPGKQEMMDAHLEIFEAIQTGIPNVAEHITRRHSDMAGETLTLFWKRKSSRSELVNHVQDYGNMPGISKSDLRSDLVGTSRNG